MSNYDEALERLHKGDLEYSGGLANHGPMGAEALETLGHHALIPAFVDLYVPRLPPAKTGRVLSMAEADAVLGDISSGPDWVASYEAQLDGGDWRAVVRSVCPELMPGLFAGAGHGLLRTAHAIRALEREDSVLRRQELARGLAYWSARYQTLPGLPGSRSPGAPVNLENEIADWPLLRNEEMRDGFFFEVAQQLDGFPEFGRVVERITRPSPSEVGEFLSSLCEMSAMLYLAHPLHRIAYVHAVTIPSAIRMLLPYLEPADHSLAAAHALQAVGALHSLFGEGCEPVPIETHDSEVRRVQGDWTELRYHAACSLQEHSIKMAEACYREDQITPSPMLRIAAADAALKIEGRGQKALC